MSYLVNRALPLCSLHICLSLSLFFQMARVQGPWKTRLLGNSETLWQLKSTLHLPSTPRGANSQRLPFTDAHTRKQPHQILLLMGLSHANIGRQHVTCQKNAIRYRQKRKKICQYLLTLQMFHIFHLGAVKLQKKPYKIAKKQNKCVIKVVHTTSLRISCHLKLYDIILFEEQTKINQSWQHFWICTWMQTRVTSKMSVCLLHKAVICIWKNCNVMFEPYEVLLRFVL